MEKMAFIKKTELGIHYLLLTCVALVVLLGVARSVDLIIEPRQIRPFRQVALVGFGLALVFMENFYWRKFRPSEETPVFRFALGSLRLAQFVFLGLSPAYLNS